ncbi:MAG: hypothetical protein H6830_08035 [Planctomycetes bacterium]|nr:hypothetical protein [Planctomycetota bacterium]MCB9909774.1 hypothetical protein [Planctomycetota bacterium]MCB9912317.1 hypothetical protein [Planctomycetota bacterium]
MKTLAKLGIAAAPLLLTSPSFGQRILYSIDWQSATVGMPDSATTTPITQGDMLSVNGGTPGLGPLVTPDIVLTHLIPGLGLNPGCVGSGPGSGCPVEVDAFSYGLDDLVTSAGIAPGHLLFSVDRFATGIGPMVPNVASESLSGDSATDVFMNTGALLVAPMGPGPSVGHRGVLDGNGLVSGSGFTYPGLGMLEPSLPSSSPQNPGDNLDALDVLAVGATPGPVAYFSLDAAFPDPLSGFPNLASGTPYGATGASVLQANFGSPPVVWAPGFLLGLETIGLADDLDALILAENGDGVFQPSIVPYDWVGGTTDMLLFSVRRGSGVIGLPDSIFGIPIEEGDILTTPLPTSFGGVSPFPGIFIAAENLGLRTVRSGTALGFGDDVNALDHHVGGFADCDGDGVDDMVAIAMGFVLDVNMNGIPDPCEGGVVCTPLPNSTGWPTNMNIFLAGGPGTGVHVDITSGPPSQFGYLLIGTGLQAPGLPIGSGVLCLATGAPNLIARYNITGGPLNSVGIFDPFGVMQNLVGTSTSGTGYDIPTAIPAPIGGVILAGQTWHFQYWHRDIPLTSNFSNAVTWTF